MERNVIYEFTAHDYHVREISRHLDCTACEISFAVLKFGCLDPVMYVTILMVPCANPGKWHQKPEITHCHGHAWPDYHDMVLISDKIDNHIESNYGSMIRSIFYDTLMPDFVASVVQ